MSHTFEAWVSENVLLTFDGDVLEVFGFEDSHRIHIAYRPDLQFTDGRRPRLLITKANEHRHEMSYDPERRAGLEAFAEQLRAAHRSQ